MRTETEGIVFRHTKATGGRTLLLVFTRKYGKISIGAGFAEKGAKNKPANATKPFAYGIYDVFKGRDIYNLNGTELKNSFFSISQDLDKYVAASYGLELTEKVIPEEVPEPEIFRLLLEFLYAMEKRKQSYLTLLIAYEVKLLSLLGHSPSLEPCAICGAQKLAGFSIFDGGMICEDCISKKLTEQSQSIANGRLIYKPKFDIVNTLRFFMEKPLSAFEKIAMEEDSARELQRIIKEYYSYHLEVGPLKSESLL